MKITGPRDVPDFRMWLLDKWRPGGDFYEMALAHRRRPDGTIVHRDGRQVLPIDEEIEQYNLPRAALWWVTSEMAGLISHAATTLPPTTLMRDLMPDNHGLVVFAEPLMGISADSGEPIDVHAMSWSLGDIRTIDGGMGEGVGINTYRYVARKEIETYLERVQSEKLPPGLQVGDEVTIEGRSKIVVHEIMDEHLWLPSGLSDWMMGADTEDPMIGFEGDDLRLASMAEDRRWLAALWLLAAAPLANLSTEQAPRPVRRRHERAKLPASSDVRLINVRGRTNTGAHERAGDDDEGEGGRRYSHRWIVGGEAGGFWRQQAYGPGWSLHRPQWIEAYEAGPKDKPLKVKESVKVVKGD